MNNQPYMIVPDTNANKSPQKKNIEAAKLVAETIRTTLGPKGMDKLLVNSQNKITVTNDGVTILEDMELDHPIAKMIVEIAQTQEDTVGDGTTTAVILAGEFLSKAEELLDRGIHPAVITKGYRIASEKAIEILNKISRTADSKSDYKKIVETAITGKGAEGFKESLVDVVVDAVMRAGDASDVKVEKKTGGVDESRLVEGLIVDKCVVHPDMPKSLVNAKVALLNCSVEIRDTETKANISITNPGQMQEYIDQEERIVKAMTDKIIASGANVVFCLKGMDDLAQYFLAKAGVMAARRVKQSDLEKLAKSTGAKVIYDINDLDSAKLGSAKLVEEKLGVEKMIHVTGGKNQNVSTILVSGGTEHVADEVCRAVEDAIGDLFALMKSGKAVAGAGAVEIELAKELAKFAKTLSGREQLAVKAFADSMEVIPKTLAENAGLDPVDVVTTLYSEHEKGNDTYGIDVFSGKTMDAWKKGIIEPVAVKIQAIKSASEVANMILRIDDVIVSQSAMPREMPRSGPNVSFPDDF